MVWQLGTTFGWMALLWFMVTLPFYGKTASLWITNTIDEMFEFGGNLEIIILISRNKILLPAQIKAVSKRDAAGLWWGFSKTVADFDSAAWLNSRKMF
jgi:hypothetical protein